MNPEIAKSTSMTQEIPVREIMTTNLITVRSNEVVTNIAEIFKTQTFHHIPIIDEMNCLVGMVSLTDFERIKNGATLFRNPKIEEYNEAVFQSLMVRDIMTKGVVHLRPMDSIQAAYKVFKENKFRALPVIEKGKLIGIVTPIDILDYFLAK